VTAGRGRRHRPGPLQLATLTQVTHSAKPSSGYWRAGPRTSLRPAAGSALDNKSRQALHTLQTVFPFHVTLRNGTKRSLFCTEKAHSMTHWADNYYTVGRCRTGSTQVTETRMKSAVKTKAKNTNNQASFGMSLLKHNQNVEAAMELSRHLDETGLRRVWTGMADLFFVC